MAVPEALLNWAETEAKTRGLVGDSWPCHWLTTESGSHLGTAATAAVPWDGGRGTSGGQGGDLAGPLRTANEPGSCLRRRMMDEMGQPTQLMTGRGGDHPGPTGGWGTAGTPSLPSRAPSATGSGSGRSSEGPGALGPGPREACVTSPVEGWMANVCSLSASC